MEVFNDPLKNSVNITLTNEFEHQWKLYDARFEYAWRYFNFHATQRTTMFNFFVVFTGFFVNGCFLLLQNHQYVLLLLASIFGIILTGVFVFLERRNEELVHVAEDILRVLEKEVLFKDFNRTIKWPKHRTWLGKMIANDKLIPLGIFIRQDYDESHKQTSKYLHGKWLPLLQLTISFLYLVIFFVALYYISFGKASESLY